MCGVWGLMETESRPFSLKTWQRWKVSLMVVCFSLLSFRFHPSVCLWVSIIYAISHCVCLLMKNTPSRDLGFFNIFALQVVDYNVTNLGLPQFNLKTKITYKWKDVLVEDEVSRDCERAHFSLVLLYPDILQSLHFVVLVLFFKALHSQLGF